MGQKDPKGKFHLDQPLFFFWCEVVVLGRVTFITEGLEDSISSFHSNFGYNEFSGIPNALYILYFWYRKVYLMEYLRKQEAWENLSPLGLFLFEGRLTDLEMGETDWMISP